MKRPTFTYLDFLLFTFYFTITTWLVIKTPFFKKLPVPAWVLAGLFFIKVGAGVYYGWFFTHMPDYKVQADTWRLYYESLIETDWLKHDPAAFIADLFSPRYQGSSGGILASSHSYWNDIKSVLVVKLMALSNLLSGGRYYVNVLFFEYLSFFGPVALCHIFIKYFPEKKWYIIAGAFLFPSTLLWCSGFHKEGLLLTSIAMAAWFVHNYLHTWVKPFPGIIFFLFHLLVIFLLRNYMAAFFVLWCIPWVIAYYYPKFKWLAFGATALVAIILFFSTSYIKKLPDLPEKLATRQQEFLQIPGESLVQPDPLQTGIRGYASALPKAIVNGFLQPLPFKIKKWSYLPAIVEILLFLLLVFNFFYVFSKRRFRKIENHSKSRGALLLFCAFYCASVFLLIGFTIPYLGAIVRYKSVVWPFIIIPLIVYLPKPSIHITNKIMKRV